MKSVFECKTHYQYLRERFDQRFAKRGSKKNAAEALQVQQAFLSQVLSEKNALSLEQADRANDFFDHTPEEAEFFLVLVSRDRAGSANLRKRFDLQLAGLLKKRNQVTERLGRKFEISAENQARYYSSWIYAAIHIATGVPETSHRKAIAAEMNLPPELVGRALDFLEQENLIVKDQDRYRLTQNWVRLDQDSPYINKHLANWRQKALQNVDVKTTRDLHYSGVYSMDRKTAELIRSRFLEFVKQQLKDIEVAKEEDVVAINFDLFSILNRSKIS